MSKNIKTSERVQVTFGNATATKHRSQGPIWSDCHLSLKERKGISEFKVFLKV